MKKAGANNVYVCASHGVFSGDSMSRISSSDIDKVVVSNSLTLPANSSNKVVQVSLAPIIADIILTEHFRSTIEVTDDSTYNTNEI